jgi:hypothetical protein
MAATQEETSVRAIYKETGVRAKKAVSEEFVTRIPH